MSKELFESIRRNKIKLDSCKGHKFSPVGKDFKVNTRITCLNCDGDVRDLDAHYYIQGYVAAGGDPEDVWSGFYGNDDPTNQTVICPSCINRNEPCGFCDTTGKVTADKARIYFKRNESETE